MYSKTLLIYDSDKLFEILNEIKANLKFNIIKFNQKNIKNLELQDKLVISTKKIKGFHNYLVLDDIPKKITHITEKINLILLKNQYLKQSKLKIKNYSLDLNSRKISLENKSLSLTQKEIDLLLYINSNNRSKLQKIQKYVWKHSSILETHTVETHIYRIRKKFLKNFNDEEFIKHDSEGYYLDEY